MFFRSIFYFCSLVSILRFFVVVKFLNKEVSDCPNNLIYITTELIFLLTVLLYFRKCVAAPRYISIFLKERVTASERYQCAEIVKEKVQLLLNISFMLRQMCGCSYMYFNVS